MLSPFTIGLAVALAVCGISPLPLPTPAAVAFRASAVSPAGPYRALSTLAGLGVDRATSLLPPGFGPTVQAGVPAVSPVPLVESDWLIMVSRGQQRITLYRLGEPVRTYTVSTGKPETVTPLGWWKIVEKRHVTPAGVYGTRWLGWERWNPRTARYEWYSESPPFGIHGTDEPEKIGTAVSSGCIRLRNADVEEVYDLIPVGTYVLVVD